MRGSVVVGRLLETDSELAVLPVYQGKTPLRGSAREADRALGGGLRRMVDGGEFRAEPRRVRLVPLLDSSRRIRPKRLLLVGMGEPAELTVDLLRGAASAAAQAARDVGLENFHAEIPQAALRAPTDAQAQAWMEGCVMGLYRMDAYKKKDADGGRRGRVRSLVLVAEDREEAAPARRGLRRGQVMAEATNFARDLVTHP
ncbi:MAG: M17 family peptidase N-terminal domain-containing protein, partial [Nitrospinota bacterium]